MIIKQELESKVTQLAHRGPIEDPTSDFSEDGLAMELVRKYQDARWVEAWRKWMLFDGARWHEDSVLVVYDRVRDLCREVATRTNDSKPPYQLRRASTVAAIERLARSDRQYAAGVDQWDLDPWVLNTPDGIVDLKTGQMRQHRADDHMTKITAASPSGECPRWLAFLSEVTGADVELAGFLQRLSGYALTGSTREHTFAFLYGTGANGKGTFLNTLRGILGDYATVSPTETFTQSNTDRHPTELAMLRGARLVIAQETESGRKWAESRIKSLTGGDPITAHFMRQDDFTFQPQFKLLIAGNHKPNLHTVDEAIRRRLHLVPFTVTVPTERRDPDLSEKLQDEWPGILQWAVEGCRQYLDHGLDPPAPVLEATNNYFEAEDTFGAWLFECCDRQPGKWDPNMILYTSWCNWNENNGYRNESQKAFTAKMEAAGIEKKRGNQGVRWEGIAIKAERRD